MSTRANYQFVSGKRGENSLAMFHLHSDGYPKGAAKYINAMWKECHNYIKNGTLDPCWHFMVIDNFYRQNTDAELCNELQGDIEYYYIINLETLEIEAQEAIHCKQEIIKFETIEQLSINEFLIKYNTLQAELDKFI